MSTPHMPDYTQQAVDSVLKERDRMIVQCLDTHAPGWLITDISRRCEIIIPPARDCEILYVDGVPRLRMYPPESKIEHDANVYKMVVTIPYQML